MDLTFTEDEKEELSLLLTKIKKNRMDREFENSEEVNWKKTKRTLINLLKTAIDENKSYIVFESVYYRETWIKIKECDGRVKAVPLSLLTELNFEYRNIGKGKLKIIL